jgi:hypothetical protein
MSSFAVAIREPSEENHIALAIGLAWCLEQCDTVDRRNFQFPPDYLNSNREKGYK